MLFTPLFLVAVQTAVPAPVLMTSPPGPPAAVLASQPASAPVPRQPLMSLFSADDYPAALAGRKGRRGAVNVKLTVGPNGRVIACNIATSSGEPVLDAATCNILRRRSLFTPAKDAQGQPTSGTVDVLVDWDVVFRNFRQR